MSENKAMAETIGHQLDTLAAGISAANLREEVQLAALRSIWDMANGETATYLPGLPEGVTPMHVAALVAKAMTRTGDVEKSP